MKGHVSRCDGISQHPYPYSNESHALFMQILQSERLRFLLDSKDPMNFQGEIAIGRNFTNTDMVWWTLRSAANEDQFKAEPFSWVYDALQDCAERDWCDANLAPR